MTRPQEQAEILKQRYNALVQERIGEDAETRFLLGRFKALAEDAIAALRQSLAPPAEKHAFDNGSGSTEVMTHDEMIAEIQRLGLLCVDYRAQLDTCQSLAPQTTGQGDEPQKNDHSAELIGQTIPDMAGTEPSPNTESVEVTITRTVNKLVNGYDAAFWNESYNLVRDAVCDHLDDCLHDDDVAEEAIIIAGIEEAARRLASNKKIHDAAFHVVMQYGAGTEEDTRKAIADLEALFQAQDDEQGGMPLPSLPAPEAT